MVVEISRQIKKLSILIIFLLDYGIILFRSEDINFIPRKPRVHRYFK